MNKREQLIADTLGSDGESFALRAAAHARRRQTIKRLSLTAGMAAVAVVALLVARPARHSPMLPSPTVPASAYEVMSDADLLAQLQPLPAGYELIVVDDRVLLIETATSLILDIVTVAAADAT